jgi:hypothetical protein
MARHRSGTTAGRSDAQYGTVHAAKLGYPEIEDKIHSGTGRVENDLMASGLTVGDFSCITHAAGGAYDSSDQAKWRTKIGWPIFRANGPA